MSTCGNCGTSAVVAGSQYCGVCSPSAAAAAAAPSSVAPARPRPTLGQDPDAKPKPSWFLTVFWSIVAVLCFIVGVSSGPWWLVLFAFASAAYAVYLFRGGRYRMWFF